ncbi:hypothetical protein [Nostoc sp.]
MNPIIYVTVIAEIANAVTKIANAIAEIANAIVCCRRVSALAFAERL